MLIKYTFLSLSFIFFSFFLSLFVVVCILEMLISFIYRFVIFQNVYL